MGRPKGSRNQIPGRRSVVRRSLECTVMTHRLLTSLLKNSGLLEQMTQDEKIQTLNLITEMTLVLQSGKRWIQDSDFKLPLK